MTRHKLIALLADGQSRPLPDGMAGVSDDTFSAIYLTAKVPMMMLPESRKTRLLGAAEHQRQLEELMGFGTVIPVRPNTFVDPSHLNALLQSNRVPLLQVAEELADRVQYQVCVSWDEAQVLAQFRDAPEIAPLFGKTAVRPDQVGQSIVTLARRLGAKMRAALADVSKAAQDLPLGPHMLCNQALLVAADQTDALDEVIVQIDAIWTEGLRIRQIGPAPAGSFATLQFDWRDAAQIVQDFALFGLKPGDMAALKPLRKQLLTSGEHPADTIRNAERCIDAVRHSQAFDGYYHCNIWREGEADAVLALKDVA